MIRTLLTLLESSPRFTDYWAVGAAWSPGRARLASTSVTGDGEAVLHAEPLLVEQLPSSLIQEFLLKTRPIWAGDNVNGVEDQLWDAMNASNERFEECGLVLVCVGRQRSSCGRAPMRATSVLFNATEFNNVH